MAANLAPRMYEEVRIKRCSFPDCGAACCLHGVWLDRLEVNDILAHADLISPWMPEDHSDPNSWLDGREEMDPFSTSRKVSHSLVLEDPDHYGGTACVFLRKDHKCALQVAGENAGFHPWRFKPFYCILHPLDLDDQGRITLDDTASLLSEPASCVQPADESVPLLVTFEKELRYLLGDRTYQELIDK